MLRNNENKYNKLETQPFPVEIACFPISEPPVRAFLMPLPTQCVGLKTDYAPSFSLDAGHINRLNSGTLLMRPAFSRLKTGQDTKSWKHDAKSKQLMQGQGLHAPQITRKSYFISVPDKYTLRSKAKQHFYREATTV